MPANNRTIISRSTLIISAISVFVLLWIDATYAFLPLGISIPLMLWAGIVLPSISTALFIDHVQANATPHNHDTPSFASRILLLSLVIAPTLTIATRSIFGELTPQGFILCAAIFSLVLLFVSHRSRGLIAHKASLALNTSHTDLFLQLTAWLGYALFIVVLLSALPTPPDLDPYYWMHQYLTTNIAGTLHSTRPFFDACVAFFVEIARVDLYTMFHLVIPVIFTLVAFPAALLARHMTSWPARSAVILVPYATASGILYTATSFPQLFFGVIFTFVILFAAHAYVTDNKQLSPYIFIGLIGATLYHEAASIPLAVYCGAALWHKRTMILSCFTTSCVKTRTFAWLLIVASIPLLWHVLHVGGAFLWRWCMHVINIVLAPNPNWLFPYTYTNIDGNVMGWSSALGVVQYYAFYMGPAVGLSLLVMLIVLVRKDLCTRILPAFAHPGVMAVIVVWAIFFAIAEIIPRFFGVAMLPDRAWTFVGIASMIFPIILLKHLPRKSARIFAWLLIPALLINIAGALYVNHLKRYVITPEHLASAQWIADNTPEASVIWYHGNRKALFVHAQRETRLLPLTCYSRIMRCRTFEHFAPSSDDAPHYIYYRADHPRNPYASRPYYTQTDSADDGFVFDRHADFRRIYSDADNGIILWQRL